MIFTFTVCYIKFTFTSQSTCLLDHLYPILMILMRVLQGCVVAVTVVFA